MSNNLFELFGGPTKHKQHTPVNTEMEELDELLEKDIIESHQLEKIGPHQCKDNIQKYKHDHKENTYVNNENKIDSKITDLKSKLQKVELERDIFYHKNEELINKLVQTNQQIKDIELSRTIIDHKIFIKLMHKTKKIKQLKKANRELTEKLNEIQIELQKQKHEINEKNKILKDKQILNNKCVKQIQSEKSKQNNLNNNMNTLKVENNKLNSQLLSFKKATQKSMVVHEHIIDKLEQNHRMIRYLQHFMESTTSSNTQLRLTAANSIEQKPFGNNIKNRSGNSGSTIHMFRIILIIIVTLLLSLSWNDGNNSKWNGNEMNNMDMFISMKQVSYEIYDKFMLSENILYFLDLILYSLNT